MEGDFLAQQEDFTTGPVWRKMIVFSGPIIIANLLQASYQFIDSLWVGNLLGAQALGAIAVSSAVIFTVLSFVLGLNNAALTILSQQKGKDDEAGQARYLNAFVVTLTGLALLMGILGIVFAENLLGILGAPDELMVDSVSYLRINFVGILFLIGYNFISTVLRAMGDSRSPLRFVFIAVILNALLDPLLIAGFDMGVEGAGYATILSQGFAFLYGLYYILSKQLAPFPVPYTPNLDEVKLILKLGIPSGLQMAVISGGVAAVMSVVTSFGGNVVAGFGAAQRLNDILMIPAQSLGIAASSMAGQNIGIKNWSRVSQISRSIVLFNFICMSLIGIVLVFVANYGMKLFIKDRAAIQFGTSYLKTIGLFYPFLGINFVLNGVVRAAGAMYQILALNFISMWVLRYPFTLLFSRHFGDMGIAYGMSASFLVSSLCAFLYYRYGKWRALELFERDQQKK